MARLSKLILTAVVLGATPTAFAEPLEGRWRGEGGVVRLGPCSAAPGAARCVVVVAGDASEKSMSDIVGTTVVRDLRPANAGEMRGRYIGDGKDLPATVRLLDHDRAQLKVCLVSWTSFALCEEVAYIRIAEPTSPSQP